MIVVLLAALAGLTSVGAAIAVERAHRPRDPEWWRAGLLSREYRKHDTGDTQ